MRLNPDQKQPSKAGKIYSLVNIKRQPVKVIRPLFRGLFLQDNHIKKKSLELLPAHSQPNINVIHSVTMLIVAWMKDYFKQKFT